MNPIRLHIIYEHGVDLKPFGVAYIRDILPLTHPANASAFQVTYSRDYAAADLVIVERSWKPNLSLPQAEQLVSQAHQDGACLVYSIDDNLLDLEQVPFAARQAISYFCRAAQGILVSTKYLKERLQHFNPRIHLLPNSLDERLFSENGQHLPVRPLPAQGQAAAPVVIGFMGTFTHDADLLMVTQALRTVLRRAGQAVELQITGGVSNPAVLRLFQGLPVQVLRPTPEETAYPNFVAWMKKNMAWDIGIAPLQDTRFTRSKSDIKFLDYSALGIPGVYSRVPSYAETVRHMETGWLAEDSPAAWIEALESLLADAALRRRLAEQAQSYVFAQRTLQHCATAWSAALRSIMEYR